MKTLAIILALATMSIVNPASTHDTQSVCGTVSAVTSEYIMIDTVDGNGWVIDRVEGYTVNDEVTITFDAMGTYDIYDDVLISVTKER